MAINLQTILVNLIRISIGKSDMKTTMSGIFILFGNALSQVVFTLLTRLFLPAALFLSFSFAKFE